MKDVFYFVMFSVALVICGATLGSAITYLSKTCQTPICVEAPERPCVLECKDCPPCIMYENLCPAQHQFNRIIADLADEHEYDLEGYNCGDYSEELYSRLTDAGYDSKICIARALWVEDGNSRHAIVKSSVYIEPITGEILTRSRFKEGYELHSCGDSLY